MQWPKVPGRLGLVVTCVSFYVAIILSTREGKLQVKYRFFLVFLFMVRSLVLSEKIKINCELKWDPMNHFSWPKVKKKKKSEQNIFWNKLLPHKNPSSATVGLVWGDWGIFSDISHCSVLNEISTRVSISVLGQHVSVMSDLVVTWYAINGPMKNALRFTERATVYGHQLFFRMLILTSDEIRLSDFLLTVSERCLNYLHPHFKTYLSFKLSWCFLFWNLLSSWIVR